EVARGRFRRDLYYRLNVFPIEMAPLRGRKEDIPLLARHFTDQVAAQMNRKSLTIRPADLKRLEAYGWPGNIRELRNVIERSIITSSGSALEFVFPDKTDPVISPGQDNFDKQSRLMYTDREMDGLIKTNIINVLGQTRGKIYGPGGAAALLGCAPTTLCSRIKKYHIHLHAFKGPISHES
ncbi:MAG: hydrogenase, partial [Proteobacteria bacterium]|nr:hydrogenase [Pseudomonadota bacterium]